MGCTANTGRTHGCSGRSEARNVGFRCRRTAGSAYVFACFWDGMLRYCLPSIQDLHREIKPSLGSLALLPRHSLTAPSDAGQVRGINIVCLFVCFHASIHPSIHARCSLHCHTEVSLAIDPASRCLLFVLLLWWWCWKWELGVGIDRGEDSDKDSVDGVRRWRFRDRKRVWVDATEEALAAWISSGVAAALFATTTGARSSVGAVVEMAVDGGLLLLLLRSGDRGIGFRAHGSGVPTALGFDFVSCTPTFFPVLSKGTSSSSQCRSCRSRHRRKHDRRALR